MKRRLLDLALIIRCYMSEVLPLHLVLACSKCVFNLCYLGVMQHHCETSLLEVLLLSPSHDPAISADA